MFPYCPGGPMRCQSAPAVLPSSATHQCPAVPPVSATHQCQLISA
ncbi:unnamed protein product, partial [Staurois parvus]